MIDLMPWAHFANVFVLIEDSSLPDTTYYLPIDDQNPFRSVRRIHDFPTKSILHFMTIGSDAKRLSCMNKTEVEQSLDYVIEKIYSKKIKIISFSHPQWSTDPDFSGAYTNAPILPPGEDLKQFYQNLAAPINESFYFAGEAYDYVNGGFMQGRRSRQFTRIFLVLEQQKSRPK